MDNNKLKIGLELVRQAVRWLAEAALWRWVDEELNRRRNRRVNDGAETPTRSEGGPSDGRSETR